MKRLFAIILPAVLAACGGGGEFSVLDVGGRADVLADLGGDPGAGDLVEPGDVPDGADEGGTDEGGLDAQNPDLPDGSDPVDAAGDESGGNDVPPADVAEPDALEDAAGDDGAPTDAHPGDAADVPEVQQCPLYHKLCGDICVNTQVSPDHCGECDTPCEAPLACSAGTCSATCMEGFIPCGGECVNPFTDRLHCGGCDEDCDEGDGCVDGNCAPMIVVGPDPEKCVGGGPPIVLPIGEGGQCAGEQAQTAFTWGICTCNDVAFANDLYTDAYDSTEGPYVAGGLGGGIGVNGAISTKNFSEVLGTIWTSGAAGMAAANWLDIRQALHLAGPLLATGQVHVGDDARIAGGIDAKNTVTIDGTLRVHPGAPVTGPVTTAATLEETFTVAPPCQCAPDQILPIADIVAMYAAPAENDNAAIGLSADVLMDPPDPTHLQLPCGKYYLSGIRTTQPLSIVVTGRTALFIDGDIESSAKLQVSLGPQAELDILVSGTLTTQNELTLGSRAYPALMRVYLGGSTLTLSNATAVGAYVYAANAAVSLFNIVEIFGGLVAGSIVAENKVRVHYDRAVLSVGENCPGTPPGEDCDSCLDCGNQACIDGQCGACTTDDECCPPLVCVAGKCLTLGIVVP